MNQKVLTDWQYRQYKKGDWLEANVPSSVHTDLRANKMIPDPFSGTNEKQLQWIDKVDWEYQTTVFIEREMLEHDQVEIIFQGLDTYATVYVNGSSVIEANNMFRQWRKDIKPFLHEGANHIRVHFRSPIQEDLPKLEALGYPLPASNDDSELGGLGDKKVSVFARKAPYHYGWDWGPRFVTSGIWKEVQLVGWSEPKLSDFYINQQFISPERAELVALVEIEANQAWQGVLEIEADNQFWGKEVKLVKGLNKVNLDLVIEQPRLWWCHTMGKPYLYQFSARLKQDETIINEDSITVGLRKIRLVRDQDQQGNTFYFELNDQPLFAKGANHIPNDSFITEVTDERYQYEIKSALAANMNMLRVWGGGIYESESFYRLCDEHGILVWQDFMFACSLYPGDSDFLANIEQEAIDAIKRLRRHPSIVLWCGNNEIDSAWAHYIEDAGWGWKQDYDQETREKLWADYRRIFHDILARVVACYAPNEPYWPSSPLADLTDDHRQHAVKVSGQGDVHYWDVWHGKKPFEDYHTHVGRFMSEYGFQSFPELKTVRSFAEEADFAIESDTMLHHQKNGAGNRLIKAYMDMYLPEPKDFPSFLYMSQLLQAEGIKAAIEAHRRSKPYCMGTLYWQMNDCWPVASWSSIDYYGRWKALHYFVKKSYQETILSFVAQDDQLYLYAISDKRMEQSGYLSVSLQDFSGVTLWRKELKLDIPADTSMLVSEFDKHALIGDRDLTTLVFSADLIIDDVAVDHKLHYFVPTKELQLPPVKITVTPTDRPFTFEVKANAFAKNIYLETNMAGYFSDNYFDLLANEVKTVQFFPRFATDHKMIKVYGQSMFEMI
ncbi:beta-mannosidase [Amphibacillus sediminis]|uniref:beta-mannosidase n=1 Tax=Amphibacillus sediminis TaxID=360185 RepID=UPI000AF0B277|nr:glycoside hydrolase family 2 protein [Amphibacillus sediminis]